MQRFRPSSLFIACAAIAIPALSAHAQFGCPNPDYTGFGVGLGPKYVYSVALLSNGDIVAGGDFYSMNGLPASRIARWDGTYWNNMNGGFTNADNHPLVYAVLAMPNEGVIAAGVFDDAAGVPMHNISQWNGVSWTSVGTGFPPVSGVQPRIMTLARLANGDVVAGGSFWKVGDVSASNVARWDGWAWSAVGAGLPEDVNVLLPLANGDLVAGCHKTVDRWNGSSWSTFGNFNQNMKHAYAIVEMPNGDVIVGGSFPFVNGVPVANIARWNGSTWSPIGTGAFNNSVRALTLLPNGDIIAGGFFNSVGGVSVKCIARWDGQSWKPLGAGFEFPVFDALTLPNGNLILGGAFYTAGGQSIPRIAQYGCPAGSTCYPDCDVSGSLNIDDFICFQTLYALGDPTADCDASGSLDIDDFVCFQTHYALGC